jgi:hypothetical protein
MAFEVDRPTGALGLTSFVESDTPEPFDAEPWMYRSVLLNADMWNNLTYSWLSPRRRRYQRIISSQDALKQMDFYALDSNRSVRWNVNWIDSLVEAQSIVQDEIDRLANRFDVLDYQGLKTYLRNYPYLISILHEAFEYLSAIAPEPAALQLELQYDPDSDATQLYAVARIHGGYDKALAVQEIVDEDWWLDVCASAQGRMNVVIEPLA